MKISRQRRTELIAKMFEVLYEHHEGLSIEAVLEQIEQSVPLTEEERSKHHPGVRSFEEAVWTGTIAPAKAGWLQNDRGHISLTSVGRRAFADFGDPKEFISKAASHSLRGWLSVNSPYAYKGAARFADQLLIEYRLIRRVGLRRLLWSSAENGNRWQNVLPVQAPQRFTIDSHLSTIDSIVEHLKSISATYFEGGHTIYIPPESGRRSAFKELLHNYPANAGIKLVKNPGDVDNSHYLREGFGIGTGESRLQRSAVYDHRRLTLIANLLYVEGIGPRLYDLMEIEGGEHVLTAYVVEHAGERAPSVSECEAGLQKIADLEHQDILKVNLPEGFADEDFECPRCNGNALMSPEGEFRYIDFQNFLLVNYPNHLKEIAREATEKSHFGDRNLLRGGTYLYQSIPGVQLPSRRKIEDRIMVLSELIEGAGLKIEGRLVLDVGCNIGGMIAQYLKLGARWCHGWDRDYVTPHTEKLLLAIGCTRFSTTGGDINRNTHLETGVPEFAQPLLDGCVISYLAVRGHLGWLEALGRIPWSFIIYEGHEDESINDFEEHLSELRKMVSFRVAATSSYADGDSDRRLVAVLLRTTNE